MTHAARIPHIVIEIAHDTPGAVIVCDTPANIIAGDAELADLAKEASAMIGKQSGGRFNASSHVVFLLCRNGGLAFPLGGRAGDWLSWDAPAISTGGPESARKWIASGGAAPLAGDAA